MSGAYTAYTVVPKTDNPRENTAIAVGTGHINHNGHLELQLNVLPINGKIIIRATN